MLITKITLLNGLQQIQKHIVEFRKTSQSQCQFDNLLYNLLNKKDKKINCFFTWKVKYL